MLRCTITLALVLASNALGQNQVWIVDVGGGVGAFSTQIQPAIDAAADGDVILVRPGSYLPFTIDKKSVSIIRDSTIISPVQVQFVEVRNLQATQRVVLHGIGTSLSPTPGTQTVPMRWFHDNAGVVIVETCAIYFGAPGVSVSNSANVVLTRCFVINGAPGIATTNSNLHLYDTAVVGANGANSTGMVLASDGADAVSVSGGSAVAVGSSLNGGAGGDGLADTLGNCDSAGAGGAAVRVAGAGAYCFTRDTYLVGGVGSATTAPCSDLGVSAVAVQLSGGAVQYTSLEVRRSLDISSPVREGGTASVRFEGKIGESAFALLSLAPQPVFIPALAGTVLPSAPFSFVPLGSVGFGGVSGFSLSIPANTVPPGMQAVEIFAQVVVPGASGKGVLGSGAVLTVVDGAL